MPFGICFAIMDNRLQFAAAGEDLPKLQAVREQSQHLQDNFWSRAVAWAGKAPNPVMPSLLLQSLNQVIDLEAARWMAFQNHVPPAVIYVNVIVALATGALVGYAFGIDLVRNMLSMWLLGLAISVVLFVIIDLDRPRRGFIRVSQQPMIDLQHQLSPPGNQSSAWP